MNSLLLSRLSKDFLNADPDFVVGKTRYRMGWASSLLAAHPDAQDIKKEKVKMLIALRQRLADLFGEEREGVALASGPRLTPPVLPRARGGLRPVRYFSRGALDQDRKRNPLPISYLLIESNETSQARPVPGNSLLLRSLCKGKGVLKQNKEGLIFLDVDNRFILSLLPYLKAYGLVRPPYFNVFASPDGAHIPVIPSREMAFHYMEGIEEVGREFSFEIEGLYSLEPSGWPEVEQVWFFKVRSPELETLRRKYFLTALPGGHSFHIAIAIKQRLLAGPAPMPVMRINIAFLAA
jgi:hypothetical protein